MLQDTQPLPLVGPSECRAEPDISELDPPESGDPLGLEFFCRGSDMPFVAVGLCVRATVQ